MLALGYVTLGVWATACPFLWILRDGLGPDSVETTGWAAVRKFTPMLLIGAVTVGCLMVLHLGEWWLRIRGRDPDAGRELP
jgi:hypothetical protein